jgi:predicted transcriptional regulator
MANLLTGVMMMGRGPFFDSSLTGAAGMLCKVTEIIEERHRLFAILAEAGGGSDPAAVSELSRRFHELDGIYHAFNHLERLLADQRELATMTADTTEDMESVRLLQAEYAQTCAEASKALYRMLLAGGHISEETVDDTDMDILRFIAYAGPEYAWRLGINIGIDTREARQRLEKLMEKELLEKVQGTMLERYHREKDWVKHMNHTYYRLSRKGKQFLRQLRRG